MKKLLFALIAAVMLLVTTACQSASSLPVSPAPATTSPVSAEPEVTAPAPSDSEPPSAGIPNPMAEVGSADDIQEALGLFITVPEEATKVQYFIIADKTAEAQFVMENIKYTHRIQATDALEDISGVYETFTKKADLEWVDYPYQIAYNEGGAGIAIWYDTLVEASYSVYMESGASEDALRSISEFLIPAG